jgi:hypothetical protein
MTANDPLAYPLEQVLGVKKRRVDEAEQNVREKQRLLKVEQEKLLKAEQARDKVQQHRDDKMMQLRMTLDEGGFKPEKILQMKAYIEVVVVKLEEENKKVAKQEEEVKTAEKNLEEAKELLKKRRHEVDKIETHKKEWTLEMQKELTKKEIAEQDEIGNVIFLKRMRDKK